MLFNKAKFEQKPRYKLTTTLQPRSGFSINVSYCLNPKCPNPTDPANENRRTCCQCGSDLLLEGRYRVIKQLGGGGFGKTFEIDDQGKCKVVKVLLKNHPKAVALFKQEAKVLSQLNHPEFLKLIPMAILPIFPKGVTKPFTVW